MGNKWSGIFTLHQKYLKQYVAHGSRCILILVYRGATQRFNNKTYRTYNVHLL